MYAYLCVYVICNLFIYANISVITKSEVYNNNNNNNKHFGEGDKGTKNI